MIPYDAAGRKLPGDGERNSRRGQNRHSTAARQLEAIWTRTRAGVLQPSGTGNVLVRPVPGGVHSGPRICKKFVRVPVCKKRRFEHGSYGAGCPEGTAGSTHLNILADSPGRPGRRPSPFGSHHRTRNWRPQIRGGGQRAMDWYGSDSVASHTRCRRRRSAADGRGRSRGRPAGVDGEDTGARACAMRCAQRRALGRPAQSDPSRSGSVAESALPARDPDPPRTRDRAGRTSTKSPRCTDADANGNTRTTCTHSERRRRRRPRRRRWR